MDVYGNIIFLILILSNWKWSRKKTLSQIPHGFWFYQSFANHQKTPPTEPISVTRKHKNHTESLGGSFIYFLFSLRTLGKMNPFRLIFSGLAHSTTNQINLIDPSQNKSTTKSSQRSPWSRSLGFYLRCSGDPKSSK